MGTMRHHSIIATCYDEKIISRVRGKCIDAMISNTNSEWRCDKLVSALMVSVVNGYCSFCIIPDGSKEGWPESDHCDKAREEIINILLSESAIEFVCIEFGGHQGDQAEILNQHNE